MNHKNIEKLSLDGDDYYILSPLTQPSDINKELFSILNKFNPLETYQIDIFVYLWTKDNRKDLLDIKRIYPSRDFCYEYDILLDDYITALSIFENRFDNKGYYGVITAYFKVDPEDDLNTKYFTNDVIFRLYDSVSSINENKIDIAVDFVEDYTSTVVTINRISKKSYDENTCWGRIFG